MPMFDVPGAAGKSYSQHDLELHVAAAVMRRE